MKPVTDPWTRLTAAARRAPDLSAPGDDAAPHGFATRVVALAAARTVRGGVFERLALRALGCAFLVMCASAAWSFALSSATAAGDDRSAELFDPVGEVLQLVHVSS